MARRRAILSYYAFQATRSYGFYLPYSVIFLERQGFGLDVIAVVQASYMVAVVGGEIPTGYVADRFGHRASFAVASLLATVSLLAYPFAGTAPVYATLLALMGLARTLVSGAGDAWLYELLATHGGEDEFARIQGRSETVRLVAGAGGALLAGALYAASPRYPFLANAGLAAIGMPILAVMPAVEGHDRGGTSVAEAARSLAVQIKRPDLRWIGAYGALLVGLIQAVRTFEQLAAESVGVSLVSLGVLYAAFKLVSAVAASTTGWLTDRFGAVGAFGLFAPVVVLTYGSVALVPTLVVPVLFLNRGLMVAFGPIRNQYVNDRIDDAGRATVLSGVSMVVSIGGAIATVLAGQLATITGPVVLVPVSGIAVGVAAVGLWLARTPEERVDETAVQDSPAPARSGEVAASCADSSDQSSRSS